MITTGPIDAFFKAPSESPSNTGDCLLYHLRSDLVLLYGAEGMTLQASPSHALLATMGILCGIDYLSQAYSARKRDHERFVETVHDLAQLSADESESLYQLRCALVHQIGLSGKSRSFGTTFIFEINDAAGKPTMLKESDSGTEVNYSVGFWELKQSFIKIINGLRRVCETPTESRHAHVINQIGRMHAEKLLKK